MSEDMIIQYCSPTLAGIKTGNLFGCPCNDKEELIESIRSLNKKLAPKGVLVIPLQITDNRALVYAYRPSRLKEDLFTDDAMNILKEYGYSATNPNVCVSRLSKRLGHKKDFPHEIGLFLGYPPEDVKGFIENRADGYKTVGCWKVYGDEESAVRQFELFKKCTRIYCRQWQEGKSIERLTVAG